MNADDKEMEMMEPLNASFKSHDSFNMETARPKEETMLPEHTGSFSIGPSKLAKYADTDGSHTGPPGSDDYKDRLVGAKLFL
jgi:hypothetical protein